MPLPNSAFNGRTWRRFAFFEFFLVYNLNCLGRTIDAAIHRTTPKNLTVVAGSTVKFGCETDTASEIRWNFDTPRLEIAQVLYTGFNVVDRFAWRVSVNISASWNEMTVKYVGTNDSGVYSCHELIKFTRNANFYLFVKGTSFCWFWSVLLSENCKLIFAQFIRT